MDEQQQESALSTLIWLGGTLLVVAVVGYFYFGT
jgi:hypothetical protein